MPNDAIITSIACFNVLLLGGLLLWMWFEIDTVEELLFEHMRWIWKSVSQNEVRPTLRRKSRKGLV